jgi:hypothetical protein
MNQCSEIRSPARGSTAEIADGIAGRLREGGDEALAIPGDGRFHETPLMV